MGNAISELRSVLDSSKEEKMDEGKGGAGQAIVDYLMTAQNPILSYTIADVEREMKNLPKLSDNYDQSQVVKAYGKLTRALNKAFRDYSKDYENIHRKYMTSKF